MLIDEPRTCIACGAGLGGPFRPQITLTCIAGEGGQEEVTVAAHAWVCPGCGLVHWYADDESLDKVLDLVTGEETLAARPGTSYERRSQMLQMLRRVRRI